MHQIQDISFNKMYFQICVQNCRHFVNLQHVKPHERYRLPVAQNLFGVIRNHVKLEKFQCTCKLSMAAEWHQYDGCDSYFPIFWLRLFQRLGVVSLTFRGLSQTFSRNLCIAKLVLCMIISSWHFVHVPKAMVWAHVQSVRLKLTPQIWFPALCIFVRSFWRARKTLANQPPGSSSGRLGAILSPECSQARGYLHCINHYGTCQASMWQLHPNIQQYIKETYLIWHPVSRLRNFARSYDQQCFRILKFTHETY